MIVDPGGPEAADNPDGTRPDELVAYASVDHGAHHLVAGVVVRLGVGVASLDVIVRLKSVEMKLVTQM